MRKFTYIRGGLMSFSKEQVPTTFNSQEIDLLKRVIVPSNTSNSEFELFVKYCMKTKLDPFSRQIYAIKTRSGQFMIQTAIDGFRVTAQETGEYRGQVGPFWCGPDGIWKDVWLSKTNPVAAKVGALRLGFAEPLYAVARFDSYVVKSNAWEKMPDLILAKCAEALALRKAFPNELSGVYTNDEISEKDDGQTVQPSVQVADSVPDAPNLVPAHSDKQTHRGPHTAAVDPLEGNCSYAPGEHGNHSKAHHGCLQIRHASRRSQPMVKTMSMTQCATSSWREGIRSRPWMLPLMSLKRPLRPLGRAIGRKCWSKYHPHLILRTLRNE